MNSNNFIEIKINMDHVFLSHPPPTANSHLSPHAHNWEFTSTAPPTLSTTGHRTWVINQRIGREKVRQCKIKQEAKRSLIGTPGPLASRTHGKRPRPQVRSPGFFYSLAAN